MTTKISSDNIQTDTLDTLGGSPTIANVSITDSSYNVLDDTAISLDGGYIKITGTKFATGCSVVVNKTSATSVTFVSATEIRAQLPAMVAGTYVMYVINTDGSVAIRVNAITYSAAPAWVTGSTLTSGSTDEAISISLNATDATSYAVQAGSTIPTGLTLSSNGLLSGTITGLTDDTTYNFNVVATDAESQDSPRSFSITITAGDVYIKYNTLLMPAPVTTFLSDSSNNNFQLTTSGGVSSSQTPFSSGGSIYFSSYNQWADVPTGSTAFQFGTGDYTIECWLKFPNSRPGTTSSLFDYRYSGGPDAPRMELSAGTLVYKNTSTVYTAPSYLPYSDQPGGGGWFHFAMARASGSAKVFINGTQLGSTFTDSFNYSSTWPLRILGAGQGTSEANIGFCSNFRVVKGTAVYTSNFTPSTTPLTAISGTTLLTFQSSTPFNNNTIVDRSSAYRTVTRNGNVKQGSLSPYGENWSVYFDGVGDYLSVPNNTALDLGSGDYTIEGWWYFADTSNQAMVSKYTASNGYVLQYQANNLRMVLGLGSTDAVYSFAWTPIPNTWYHVAITRSGTSGRAFVNGVQIGSTTTFTTSNTIGATTLQIGSTHTVSELTRGYVSNFRLVKGTAVYTSAFTPPTAPLSNISGTGLLTCRDNRPLDISSYTHTVTPAGNVSFRPFSPFTKGSVTATSNHSVRFNGSGLINVNYNSALDLSSGDFTLEMWIFPFALQGMVLVFAGGNNIAWASYELCMTSGVGINFAASSSNNGYDIGSETTSTGRMGVPQLNAWNHVAVTRSGNVYRGFVNGVLGFTITTALRPYNPNARGLILGANYNATWGGSSLLDPTNCHMSNVRLVKGTALYTADFTPPTAPLTAVSGTSLLTCQSDTIKDNSTNNFAVTLPAPFSGSVRTSRLSPFASDVTYTNKQQYTANTFGGSMHFDGTGDYLTLADSMNVGTSDFTLQAWVHPTAWVEWQSVFSTRATTAGSAVQWCLGVNQNGYPYVYSDGFQVQGSNGHVTLDTWNHLCVSRSGSTMRLFVNGSQVAANTSTSQNYSTGSAAIGANYNGSEPWTGYIADVSLVTGRALHVAPFVPPDRPLTAVANTVLLLSGTNAAIVDAAAKTAVETVGDAKISSAISKFTGSSSMYFDGSGDYVFAPSSHEYNLSTGDFTIEAWFRPATVNEYRGVIGLGTAGSSTGIGIQQRNDAGLNITYVGTYQATSGLTLSANTWYHLALVRNSSSIQLYVNGTSRASVTRSDNLGTGSWSLYVGHGFGISGGQLILESPFSGYLQDVRITKGVARYTSAFTPPTSKFLVN